MRYYLIATCMFFAACAPTLPSALAKGSVTETTALLHAGDTVVRIPRPTPRGVNISVSDQSRIICSEESNGASEHHQIKHKLIQALKPIELEFDDCTVKIGTGALVLICAGDDWTAIHNLHDRRMNSVCVSKEGCDLTLEPGEEMILAASKDRLFALLASCPIGRRALQMYQLPDDRAVGLCETRFCDLVHTNELLTTVIRSDASLHRQIRGKVLKTAASNMIAAIGKGPYHKFILGEKPMPEHALTPEVLQEMRTLAKHPSRGGFKGQ